MSTSRARLLASVGLLFMSSGAALGTTYDFSSSAGVDRFAYKYGVFKEAIPPLNNTQPSLAFFAAEYAAIASSDDVRYMTGPIEGGNVAAVRFVFSISEPAGAIAQLDVAYEGSSDQDKPQVLWLWNAAGGFYMEVGSQVSQPPAPGLPPLDAIVSGTFTETAAQYIDANGNLTILLTLGEEGGGLNVDYVSATVTGAGCGVDADCDDGVFCNGSELCVAGACQVAAPRDCDDGNACTADSCNEQAGVCDHANVACDDGLYCNGIETCNPASGCQAGIPVSCDDADLCTADSCDELTDTCDYAPLGPPVAADAPNPSGGAIDIPVDTTLTWNGGPAGRPGCGKTFDVYLDIANPPITLVAGGLTDTVYTPVPLAEVTTYFWQVVSHDCCGTTAGPVWSFATAGTPVLTATPAALAFAPNPDQITTVQVTLTNSGNAATTWTASEAAPGAAGEAASTPPPPDDVPPAVDWTRPHEPNTLLVSFKQASDAVVPERAGQRGRGAGSKRTSTASAATTLAETVRAGIHATCGTTKVRSCQTIPVDVVEVPAGRDLQAVAALYAARPEVDFVEPNYIHHANALPNDPSLGSLWGMHNTGQTGGTIDADIDAVEAWNIATGSPDIIVGVIDTGVDYNHPELAGNMWTNPAELNGTAGVDDDANGIVDDIYGARWVSGNGLPTSGNPYDDHYHGTHCAGTIGAAGNNSLGVVGVNWNVRIMALKFLNAGGSGSTADAISAVEYAVAKGAHLTSNSWGGGGYSQALKNAIDAAGAAGQLFVAAAGNYSWNTDVTPFYPTAYSSPTIISVAATDHNDLRASFSNYGATTVDLGAPGVAIVSTSPGGAYRTLNGTSMACPHVSGVVALLLSRDPTLAPLALKQMILDSVDPIASMNGITVSGGRLNAANALALVNPWLSFAPTSGALAPGQSTVIDVTASAAGLAPGFVDSRVIRVASGDPLGPLDIPVGIAVGTCSLDSDCDDGLQCNGAETCGVSGVCQPGTPIACDDGVACTTDTCVEATGGCDHVPDDAACHNGIFCDGVEVCDAALGCLAGAPTNCDDGLACSIDTCNEAAAACDHLPDTPDCITGPVWYVNDDATGSNNGTSWANAFNLLQDALAVAAYGDQVWVAGGTYKPDQGGGKIPGDINATFDLADGVALRGHFGGTETLPSERNMLDMADPLRASVLSGEIGAGGTADNSWRVVTATQLSDRAVLESFTITAAFGRSGMWPGSLAGGLLVDQGNPTISNCTFTANEGRYGGGVGINFGSPTFTNCTFSGNLVGDDGAGIFNYYASPVLIGCRFLGNLADGYGGGMAEWGGTSTLTDCSFIGNTVPTFGTAGGGLSVVQIGQPTITNCLFAGNTAPLGGGIANLSGFPTVTNCTVVANSATNALGGVYGAATVANCVVWANTSPCATCTTESKQISALATINYSNIEGWTGLLGGVGNIGADPLFVASAVGNYRVASGSPCVDAADNGAVPAGVLADLDGLPRFLDDPSVVDTGAGVAPIVDMGAYEFDARCATDADCDDGVYCNGVETCSAAGYCLAAAATDCDDGVACTVDACNEAAGACDHTPSDAACDNGMFCDGSETCDALLGCQAGAPPTCDDGIACTLDSCGEGLGCQNTADDAACDNGLFCDGAETCHVSVGCVLAGDPCPGQFCDETGDTCVGCVLDTDCDDGVFCNGAETCDALGVCQAGAPADCNDGVGCTADSCNEAASSCDNVPSDAACDNGLACDGVETCDAVLDCQAGAPVDCDDGVTCTVDACNEPSGTCTNVPNHAVCDNGSFCDGAETCDALLDCLIGTAPDCSGLTDHCNVGVCDDVAAACVAESVVDGTACDDGDACTGDTCQAGVCVPFNCGPPPPAAPVGLVGEIGEKAALAWEPNTEADLAGYNVYRSSASGGPYTQVATMSPESQYEGFPPAGYYCYVVTAVNTGGNESDYSNEVCGTASGGG